MTGNRMWMLALVGAAFGVGAPALADDTDTPAPAEAAKLDDALDRLEAARAALAEAEKAYHAARADYERVVQPADAPAGDGADAIPPESLSFWKGWEGSVELGITGSAGNSETFNFRTGIALERIRPKMETRVGLLYNYSTDDGSETKNRFEASARNDWLMPDSRWRYFVQGKYEFDEFQSWDSRISGFGGVGYEFIRPEDQPANLSLVGRAGLGGAQTIGGPDESFTPEALLGLDFDWVIKDGQKFFVHTELFPSLDEFGDFRWITDVGYEILLSQENNLFLKLGVQDRYDTNPGGMAKRNDVDYYVTLGWKF